MLYLSNAKVKFYQSLKEKKYRREHSLFSAEGKKIIADGWEAGFDYEAIILRDDIPVPDFLRETNPDKIFLATAAQFNRLSVQEQSEGILAIAKTFPEPIFDEQKPILALYKISDPGNLGTLIRTALWFGVHQLLCDPHTVDVYNPKVVRSAMGGLWKIKIRYDADFPSFLNARKERVRAADLTGEVIGFDTDLPSDGILLLGNESNGLTGLPAEGWKTVRIPGGAEMESLNVGVAAGILLHHWHQKHGI